MSSDPDQEVRITELKSQLVALSKELELVVFLAQRAGVSIPASVRETQLAVFRSWTHPPFSNINITSMRCRKCKTACVPEGDGMLRDSFVSGCSCRAGFEFIYEYNP